MSDKIKLNARYVLFGLDYLLWAVIFVVYTYVLYIFGGSELNVYVNNILNISVFLIIDKIRRRSIYKRLEAPLPEDEKERKILAKKDVGSVKTSLYLLYIFALVASHAVALDANIGIPESVRGYLQTVEKGILVLFAMDNFLFNFIGDIKRQKEYTNKFRNKQDT